MSKENENPIPEEYWNDGDVASMEEMEALQAAANEMEEYLSQPTDEWSEMDDVYYDHLRERFKKGPDEIGPRQFKQFQNVFLPLGSPLSQKRKIKIKFLFPFCLKEKKKSLFIPKSSLF